MTNSATAKGHPAGLYVLFFTEMWERFSYYGMRAIFVLYLINALLFDKSLASNLYGSYTGLVYLTPLLGGYIADKYWGNRKSILAGGIIMAVGQFLMFLSGSMLSNIETAKLMMYFGLAALVFGNGFFKPNISTMVGQLYPTADKRVDSAFTIFYMGINLGAFFSPLICGGLGDTGDPNDFKWGFLAACIGMLISTISFYFLKNKYLVTPEGGAVGLPKTRAEKLSNVNEKGETSTPTFSMGSVGMWGLIFLGLAILLRFAAGQDWIGAFIFSAALAVPGLIITDKSLNAIERSRIWVIFILAFFVIFFWSAFEQAGASLTFFAEEQTDRSLGNFSFKIFGYTYTAVPASWFQSINPLGIIVLAPLFTVLWGWLGKRNMEPSSPLKMALGLLLLSLGYVVIAFGVKGVDASTKASMWLLFSMYLLHTMGELCLSPIGLSMVSKLAPLRFASLLMGTWFLANAAANKLAGTLSALYPPGQGEFSSAAKEGIDLPGILNGTSQATQTQLAKLSELGIRTEWPTFFGNNITNLFEFFTIFMITSAAAAFILFILYRKLRKMMQGIN
ncbi:MAG: peptide MFS transporter [Chitinophagales bacterium]|nr:peptide MFS transporter [Chitinophagales bacterium]